MGTEIERKFLVADDSWRQLASGKKEITQGYLANSDRGSIRVRVAGNQATLNIKSMTLAITRTEFEYALPLPDAEVMLRDLCIQPLINKTRWYVDSGGKRWEIDEFHGANAGLVIAEVELVSSGETFQKPGWLGQEVSDDPRYYNVCLVEHPYREWKRT